MAAKVDPTIQKESIERSSSPSSSTLTADKTGHLVDTKSVDDDLLDAEPEPFKLSNWLFRRHLLKTTGLDATATRRSVYDNPDLAEYYWPKPEYENLHRFDPKARWTLREEKV